MEVIHRRHGMPSRVLFAVALSVIAPVASTGSQSSPTLASASTAMPIGDLPGWRQIFADDFSRRTLGNSWFPYSGQPGSDPAAWWDPSHLAVSHGQLVIRTSREMTPLGLRWVSGGIGLNDRYAGIYGRYSIRMRMEGGRGISAIALLWPMSSWPPEVDFYEDSPSARTRNSMSATVHYGAADNQLQRTLHGVDFTQWHTIGLVWSPGLLSFTVDGRSWARISGSSVPTQAMNLAIQVQALQCTGTWHICPGRSTPRVVKMDIAWVVVYQPIPYAGV